MTAFPVFDKTIQKTMIIIDEVSTEGKFHDREQAFKALRGTLHTLRDRLPVNVAAQIGAQLPILLSGFFYEGWKPAATPQKDRTQEEFLEHIQEYLSDKAPQMNAMHAAQTVFKVLSNHISEGQIEDIQKALPEGLRKLWPEKAQELA
ncbi:MAG TPA: DUF2267 domain-containing protein [Balneolaceae bacterium]|nr:DUF2267 domain-containing protein [Balneolaceae bacterium]